MRQKIRAKNLDYPFFRLDKEKNIQIFQKAGWHFNNLMSPENISLKLKTFAHSEFSSDNYSSPDIIKDKIKKRIDLFDRGHQYTKLNLDNEFPKYLIDNKLKYKNYIID